MKIQILGTGCHNCLELEMLLAEAVAKSGQADVEIDGRLVSQREVPTIETMLNWLKAVPA